MPSVIKICNLALSHIRINPIQSLTEASKAARECNRIFEINCDAVLEDHDWDFARKRLVLSLTTDDYSGWDYAYNYPTDCIAPRKIYNAASDNDLIELEVGVNSDLNKKVILTNEEDAELIYTARVDNPNLFSSGFIKALAYNLASDLAQPLRGDTKLQENMLNIYMSIIGKAQASNANQSHKEPSNDSSFLEARL